MIRSFSRFKIKTSSNAVNNSRQLETTSKKFRINQTRCFEIYNELHLVRICDLYNSSQYLNLYIFVSCIELIRNYLEELFHSFLRFCHSSKYNSSRTQDQYSRKCVYYYFTRFFTFLSSHQIQIIMQNLCIRFCHSRAACIYMFLAHSRSDSATLPRMAVYIRFPAHSDSHKERKSQKLKHWHSHHFLKI